MNTIEEYSTDSFPLLPMPSDDPPLLAPVLTVGVSSSVPGAIACLNKDVVAYVSGHCISTCSVNSSHQSRISEPLPSTRAITAMASSKDKKWLAVAESTQGELEQPRIAILGASARNLMERQVLGGWGGHRALQPGHHVNVYNCLAFSDDSLTIIAAGYNDNEVEKEDAKGNIIPIMSQIHTWEWQAASDGHQPSGSFATLGKVLKVSIHPKYTTNAITMTASELILWRRGSSGFRKQELEGSASLLSYGSGPEHTQASFVDHAWLSDGRLAVAMSHRRLAIIDGSSVVEIHEIGKSINCILALHDNLILLSLAKGGLACFSCNKETGKLDIVSMIQLPDSALSGGSSDLGITHLSASYASLAAFGGIFAGSFKRRSSQGLPKDPPDSSDSIVESVACYVHHGPVLMLDVGLALGSSFSEDDSHEMFEEVLPSTHHGAVSSISCASNRALIATCSSDDVTVRVWEYSPLRQVLTHSCHHAPLAVGMDPLGRELVVCYVDSCRCYSIVEGSLLEVCQMLMEVQHGQDITSVEMLKCSMVKYNPTGHLIAVVGGERNKDVIIFSALYHKQLAVLHGHFTSILDICWSADGLLLSTASDSEVFTWHMETFKKVQSHNSKTFNNNAVACSLDFKTIAVGDGGQGLKILATNRYPQGSPPSLSPRRASASGSSFAHRTSNSNAPERELISKPSVVWAPTTSGVGGGNNMDPFSEAANQPFVVPGKAHLARQASALMNRSLQTAASSASFENRSPRKMEARPQAAPPPSIPINSISASDLIPMGLLPTSVNPAKACLALVEYSGSGSVKDKGWQAMIGSQSLRQGRARICNLPTLSISLSESGEPREIFDIVQQEYALHSTEISSLVAHPNGRVVFSADTSGIWKLHILLPPFPRPRATSPSLAVPSSPSLSGLSGTPARVPSPARNAKRAASMKNLNLISSAPLTVMPPYSDVQAACLKALSFLMPRERDSSSDFVSVTSSDLRHLKENTRELKDKLAKQGHQAEFQVYQKEQEVRRELEGDLAYWRKEAEENAAQLLTTRNQLQETTQAHEQAEVAMHQALLNAVEEERDKFMSKLSHEVDRTATAEKEVDKMRVKFGKKLWEVEEERVASVKASSIHAAELENQAREAKRSAVKEIKDARASMAIEATIDMEWNEEDVARVTAHSSALVQAERQKLEELLAKHTLQAGLYHKTLQENQDLKESSEQLKAEKFLLSNQLLGLNEELEAMHTAWMERDGRQRAMDLELKELMSRMQQANVFTTLANSRIAELSNELEPGRQAKAEALELVAKLEQLQVKQAEKKVAQAHEHEELRARYERLREEVKTSKRRTEVREEYFANFTTQLFRLVSTVDHHQWPVVFGKLYVDYQAGKDLANWAKYLPDHTGTTSGATLKKTVGERQQQQILSAQAGGLSTALSTPLSEDAATSSHLIDHHPTAPPLIPSVPLVTEFEFQQEMKELQTQVKYLEKQLAATKESRDKAEASQKSVIHRLVQENSIILDESNGLKRELRSSKEAAERLSMETKTLQLQLASYISGGLGPGAVSSSGGGRSSQAQHRLASGRKGSDPYPSDLLPSERELSSSELIAAAAAHNASLSAAAASSSMDHFPSRPNSSGSMLGGMMSPRYDPGGGGLSGLGTSNSHLSTSSRIPQAIPEDSPLSHNDAHATKAAAVNVGGGGPASRPSSSTVNGEMPSGGWWLGVGSPFEVPASLNKILKGGNPSSPGSSSVLLSASSPPSRAGAGAGSRPGSRAGTTQSPGGGEMWARSPKNLPSSPSTPTATLISTPIASAMPRTPSLSRQAEPVLTRPGTSSSSTQIGITSAENATEVSSSVSALAALTDSMRGGTAPAQMASYRSGPGGFMGINRGLTPTAGSITARPGYYPPSSSHSHTSPYDGRGSGKDGRNKKAGGGDHDSASRGQGHPSSLQVGGSGVTMGGQPSPSLGENQKHGGAKGEKKREEGEEEEVEEGERGRKGDLDSPLALPPRIHVLPKAFVDSITKASSPTSLRSPSSPQVRMASLGAGFRSFHHQPRQKDY